MAIPSTSMLVVISILQIVLGHYTRGREKEGGGVERNEEEGGPNLVGPLLGWND